MIGSKLLRPSILAAALCLAVGGAASAGPIGQLTNEIYNDSGSGGNYTNASSITVGTNDLLEGMMPISTNYVGTFEANGGNLGVLTDGQTAANPSNFGNASLNPSEPTHANNAAFDLNGTGWYAEYDLGKANNLSSVVVTTGHQDNRVNQTYDILGSNDGVTFTSLSDGSSQTLGNAGSGFNYSPSSGDGGAAQSTVSPISGNSLGSYRYLEFVETSGGQNVYRELDAYGSASAVPEPATLTLAAFGMVSLCGYGLRRRKVMA